VAGGSESTRVSAAIRERGAAESIAQVYRPWMEEVLVTESPGLPPRPLWQIIGQARILANPSSHDLRKWPR